MLQIFAFIVFILSLIGLIVIRPKKKWKLPRPFTILNLTLSLALIIIPISSILLIPESGHWFGGPSYEISEETYLSTKSQILNDGMAMDMEFKIFLDGYENQNVFYDVTVKDPSGVPIKSYENSRIIAVNEHSGLGEVWDRIAFETRESGNYTIEFITSGGMGELTGINYLYFKQVPIWTDRILDSIFIGALVGVFAIWLSLFYKQRTKRNNTEAEEFQ